MHLEVNFRYELHFRKRRKPCHRRDTDVITSLVTRRLAIITADSQIEINGPPRRTWTPRELSAASLHTSISIFINATILHYVDTVIACLSHNRVALIVSLHVYFNARACRLGSAQWLAEININGVCIGSSLWIKIDNYHEIDPTLHRNCKQISSTIDKWCFRKVIAHTIEAFISNKLMG